MNRYKTKKTINVLLKTLTLSGLVGSAMIAPNATELFTKLARPITDLDIDDKELKRLLKYMERTKLVELHIRDGDLYASLTKKAQLRLSDVLIDEIEIPVQAKWDKKWRIIIYDIPKVKKENRYQMLEQLHRLNFYRLQDSTWVYPFPCSVEIFEILTRYELANHVTFIVGDIETKDESKLIKHFQLFKNN
jgi:DNA-binding transcriptional regulator PaaX